MKTRKKLRLKNYDYSQEGIYFITILTHNKEYYFGNINDNIMNLNILGKIVKDSYLDLVNHYKNIKLGEFIIMPNHIHCLIEIFNKFDIKRYSISEIIRGFKTFSSKKINNLQTDLNFKWHKSFYDHIVRKEDNLENIKNYIKYNPIKWKDDNYYKFM